MHLVIWRTITLKAGSSSPVMHSSVNLLVVPIYPWAILNSWRRPSKRTCIPYRKVLLFIPDMARLQPSDTKKKAQSVRTLLSRTTPVWVARQGLSDQGCRCGVAGQGLCRSGLPVGLSVQVAIQDFATVWVLPVRTAARGYAQFRSRRYLFVMGAWR